MATMRAMWTGVDSGIRRVHDTAYDVPVRDVMSWPALAVNVATPVERALTLAMEQGIHHLLVLQRGSLVGVLCTCDLRESPPIAPVGLRMSRHVVTVQHHAPLTNAADMMADYGVGCLPVRWLEAWGVVTRGDLVRSGACERRICPACGGSHHVRPDPRYRGMDLCVECTSRANIDTTDRLYMDLGGGD
jgi:CBS domain-containing protein